MLNMTRMITYWLVMNVHEYLMGSGDQVYYCLDESRNASTTSNPKKAMRFLTEEGAQAQAHCAGWYWSVVEKQFRGDEQAI
jgi:hypothetical protein